MNTKVLDVILLTFVIVGAINWGLVGFFRFNLVTFLFGNMTWFSRVLYAIIGISGLYMLSAYNRIRSANE